MGDILLRACEKVVQADYIMSVQNEPFAEMGTDEAGPPVTRIRFGLLYVPYLYIGSTYAKITKPTLGK